VGTNLFRACVVSVDATLSLFHPGFTPTASVIAGQRGKRQQERPFRTYKIEQITRH
jgi:hypothetical protein